MYKYGLSNRILNRIRYMVRYGIKWVVFIGLWLLYMCNNLRYIRYKGYYVK